jgi:putative nucleotidyltransferase with HDIG domain
MTEATRFAAAGEAAEFLTSLGNLLSVASLYPSNHPARRRSLDRCWGHLQGLLEREEPSFSFLDDVVLHGAELLHHFRSWELGLRLYESGIERIEFRRGVDREELGELVEHLQERLAGSAGDSIEEAESVLPHIRVGGVGLRATSRHEGDTAKADSAVPLDEEVDVVSWIYDQATERDRVPAAEVRLAVASLSLMLEDLHHWGAGMIAIKSHDQYTAIHCVNVAILSMTFAERLGFIPDEVRIIGEAGLLHDIGKTRTPDEVLNKPGKLTAEERAVIEEHSVEGCRLALEPPLEHWLAATVAYEHHMASDGKGYPKMRYERDPHPISRLVQVCDVYDALRTRRPFRGPMSGEDSLTFLKDRAGTLLHKALVKQFVEMVEAPEFDVPLVLPEPGFSDAHEREAVRAGQQSGDAGTPSSTSDAFAAPEPTAVIDWLGIL